MFFFSIQILGTVLVLGMNGYTASRINRNNGKYMFDASEFCVFLKMCISYQECISTAMNFY